MVILEQLETYPKEDLCALAETLDPDDLAHLVVWLDEKEDKKRYPVFLLLQHRSQTHADVYPFWDVLAGKLDSANSYQRSIGLMLIAENAKWDGQGKMEAIIDAFLSCCDDEKPITVRQCIQSLRKVAPYKKNLHVKIVEKLTSINISSRKATQRKILLMDILSVLAVIQKMEFHAEIERFRCSAMTGGILDMKAKKEIDLLFMGD